MPQTQNPFGLSKVKHVIAVSSCKGGVGKSTIAAGMAKALCSRGHAVGLLDADIFGPSMPVLFNLPSVAVHMDEFKMFTPVEAEGLKLMSFGFLLGDAPAVMRGPIVTRYIQQLLLQTQWGELDFLMIDMPPGTGDVQLTITQSVRLTGAVIVTTPSTLSLVDVARGILMFAKVNVPMLGIIDNMAYFVCDACSTKHHLFGKEHLLEERFGLPCLAQIPLATPDQMEGFFIKATDAMVQAVEGLSSAGQTLPEVSFDQTHIYLRFPDGHQVKMSHHDVRAKCMCALCINELSGKQILDPSKIRTDIAPKEITRLGNYAISIVWNDGHSSGVYPYKMFSVYA